MALTQFQSVRFLSSHFIIGILHRKQRNPQLTTVEAAKDRLDDVLLTRQTMCRAGRASLWPSSSLPAGRCMGLYGSRLAPTTAMAPRSSREKLRSADQPSRMASSALAAPALPGRYLRVFSPSK